MQNTSTLLQCLVFFFFSFYSNNTNSAAPSMFSMCSHVCFSLNMRLWQGLISLRWLYTAAHFLFGTVHACPATGACIPPVDQGTDGELCLSTAHLWEFWLSSMLGSVSGLPVCSMIWFKIFITVDWFCFLPSFFKMLPVKHQKRTKICLYPPDYLFSVNEGYIYTSLQYSECIIVLYR